VKFIDGILLPGILKGDLHIEDGIATYVENGERKGRVYPTVGQLEFMMRIKKLRKLEAK
jgi:hypothetical protein